jgi:monoamine oxidase
MESEMRPDAIVVGAGYSGLAAAAALRRAGAEVVVVEARDRVGGRVWTARTHSGAAVDLGGQWVGADHSRLRALAAERDLALVAGWEEGDYWLEDSGRRSGIGLRGALSRPVLSTGTLLALWRLGRLAEQIDVEQPWTHPRAESLDSMTMQQWIRRSAPMPSSRRVIETILGESLAADMDETSVLATIAAMAGAGGLSHALSSDGGAQDSVFADGADAVARSLAAELGDRVLFGHRVNAVVDEGASVVVTGDWGDIRADALIVAVPPALAGRIEYRPGLPASRDRATQRLAMGAVYKAIAVYEQPFWREQGLSGDSLRTAGTVRNTFDAAPGSPHAMLGTLVTGREAMRIGQLGEDARRREVIDRFTACFGSGASDPVEFHEKDWTADPLSGGGYCGVAPPGYVTATRDSLAAPVGRIHWASTETTWRHNGYIEGAIRSGEQAAASVAAVLS